MNPGENEKPVVRTTIVGGRPPGSGRGIGRIPRGVEVLLKKAAVDPEFCEKLLEQRAGAGAMIGMELDPLEKAMLGSVSREQLAQIIAQTVVPTEQRRAFLGQLATAMLAVLGVAVAGCEPQAVSLGAQPDKPTQPASRGIQPDRPQPSTNPPPPETYTTKGIRPDRPAPSTTNAISNPVAPIPSTQGIRPDRP